MTEAFFGRAFQVDIATRVRAVKGRAPIRVDVTEIAEGIVDRTERWTVTAAEVDHWQSLCPDIPSPCYGYRVDTPEGSIVISGDTRPCERLVRLAAEADVLVHECGFTDEERERAAKMGRPPLWHITASELGKGAGEARAEARVPP